ncbi:hypothetical protein DV20_01265 [Amycolatopsis rifamycinica]|uniref:Major facilitator superfamily (MFS) profile domain-containing protein n=2 Tax=Amycolatopsis rifamycinica TaxID=287986 RepID=A0A066UII2_9PSEU|nr:hypothetical protein DV20_01265 [Amycolatopsis rifamycinica]
MMTSSRSPELADQPGLFHFGVAAWGRLIALCSALLFEGMSLSGINVQTADIGNALHLAPDTLQLVASAFLTSYAGFLLLGGRWTDAFGARRIFLWGVTVFGLGSLGAALAQNAVEIISARCVQGIGSALTAPAAVALIVHAFPEGRPRSRALGVFGAMGAVGFSLGLVMSGLLTEVFNWRWVFATYVPLTAVVVLAVALLIGPAPRSAIRAGWPPAVLGTAGLLLTVYEVGRIGTAPAIELVVVIAAGIVLLAAFLRLQARSAHPLLPLRILLDRRMLLASVGLGGMFAAIGGAMFVVGTELQQAGGHTAFDVGLSFLPQGITVSIISLFSGRLMNKLTPSVTVVASLTALAAGMVLYTQVLTGAYLAVFLPACVLVGTSIAAMYPAALTLAGNSATAQEQGTASGLLITAQQAGGALGVAAATGAQTLAGSVSAAMWTTTAIAALALIGCAALAVRHPGRSVAPPPP